MREASCRKHLSTVSRMRQSASGTPDGTTTALELPAGLITSPATGTRMRAPRTPRTVGAVTEVWVARLERGTGRKPANVYAIENLLATDPVSRTPLVVPLGRHHGTDPEGTTR